MMFNDESDAKPVKADKKDLEIAMAMSLLIASAILRIVTDYSGTEKKFIQYCMAEMLIPKKFEDMLDGLKNTSLIYEEDGRLYFKNSTN